MRARELLGVFALGAVLALIALARLLPVATERVPGSPDVLLVLSLLMISAEHEKFYPLEFFLKQNVPNPCPSKTKIKYCVAYKAKVIFLVIDNDENVVEKLISKEQDAGLYEIEFNADGLAEGTYYYQLIAGNYSATKQMEFIKKAEIPPQHSNEEGGNCL